MINSPLIQHDLRNALAARDIISLGHRGAISALVLVVMLAVGMLAGGPSVLAQEQVAPAASSAITPAAKPSATGVKVNINTADAQTLAAGLKGVGAARAEEIIRYRETYGPFASADELIEVKGIGPSTLDMNRDVITLE